MSTLGALNWQNENSLTPYPLEKSFGWDGVIVDANFLQFDGFVPILKTLRVTDVGITLVIEFDSGEQTVEITSSNFTVAQRVYDNTRYLGSILLGYDANVLLNEFMGQLITMNIPFLSCVVKSVPSKSGVFSINTLFGNIEFESDENIWYTVAGQNITFNAVGLGDTSGGNYLKTLNSVTPVENSVYLQETEIIKITTPTLNTVEISLVGNVDEKNIITTNVTPE